MKLKYEHLIGKPFVHAVDDCYTVLQQVMKDNCNIILADYARPEAWWTIGEMNLYLENYKKEGYRMIDVDDLSQIRPLDVFLIAIPDPRRPEKTVVNHCAIYIGNGEVLHHPYGRNSEVRTYRGYLRNFTVMTIRHKEVGDLTDRTEEKMDIMSKLLPHKRELLQRIMNEQKDRAD